jgi:hypothetical protein
VNLMEYGIATRVRRSGSEGGLILEVLCLRLRDFRSPLLCQFT